MATTSARAPDRDVLTRPERIAALGCEEARAPEVLLELRCPLRDAERLTGCRDGEEVVARRREAPHGT